MHAAHARLRASLQVVDKSRYAAGDNSLEREIQVLCKVRQVAGAAVQQVQQRQQGQQGQKGRSCAPPGVKLGLHRGIDGGVVGRICARCGGRVD